MAEPIGLLCRLALQYNVPHTLRMAHGLPSAELLEHSRACIHQALYMLDELSAGSFHRNGMQRNSILLTIDVRYFRICIRSIQPRK